jgi:hypothetical protein
LAQRHLPCDTQRLRLLLEDALTTPKQAEVIQHLDECAPCQDALEKLAADRHLWNELPFLNDWDNQGPEESPWVDHKMPTLPVIGKQKIDAQGGSFALDFLDPAEKPEHVGRLDRFAITAFLGRGGMGVVLKAFDAGLNRPVAIKVLAPYFASSGAARQRFDREAKAAATVVHPNVVAIHAVETWKGLPYLVMSYVPGRSLQERLDSDGPLAVKDVLRIGMQTASGLAAAHAQGLVHRDVKPANILLENGVGRVWLTDFGLARAVDDASLTQSGVIAGTPQYMAPEQALGQAVDHRADLFSLGSTLYAMCTAHAPFRAESAMAVLRRVCDDQPRPLPSVNPEVPGWLARLIERLHAKKPEERFQSAAEVADLLEKCLAYLQQPDTNPLPAELALTARSAPTKRPRWRWTASLALLLACLAGLTGLGWSWLQDHDAGHEAKKKISVAGVAKREAGVTVSRIVTDEGRTLEAQVDWLRGRAAALAADMTHPAVQILGDPIDELLADTRRRLEALERELTTKKQK